MGDIACGGGRAEGSVGVGGAGVAVLTEDLADVFGEIPAIGEPGAVKLDGQRTGGDRLIRRHPIAGSPHAGQTRFAVCPIPLRALGGFEWGPTRYTRGPDGGCG